jgi:signal peptidase I
VLVDVLRLPRIHPLPRPRLVVLIGVGVAIFYDLLGVRVRTNFVEAFNIPSASMYPTIDVGDHIFVKKTNPPFRRGEIVVFGYPPNPSIDYVKRIVAIGGDVVEIRDEQVSINGRPIARRPLDQDCLYGSDPSLGACKLWEETLDGNTYQTATELERRAGDFGPVTVPAGKYFVLGDNRDNSADSRVYGPIAADLIKGPPMFVYWSRGPWGVRWERINQPVR